MHPRVIGLQFNVRAKSSSATSSFSRWGWRTLAGNWRRPRPVAGWKVFPDKKSVFTVTGGTLNMKGGNGQLESGT